MSFLTDEDRGVLREMATGNRWVMWWPDCWMIQRVRDELARLERCEKESVSQLSSLQINLDESTREVDELKKNLFEKDELIRKLRTEKYEADTRANQAEARFSAKVKELAEAKAVLDGIREMVN